MTYVDGFMAAVPANKKADYIDFNKRMGKVTSMTMAVKCQEGEVACFSWITWPPKEARQTCMGKSMEDPRMRDAKMPFDGQRIIFGGFEMVSSQ